MGAKTLTFNFTPAFHSKLIVEDDGGFPFTLKQQLVYVTNVGRRGTMVVPVGFKTDFASIPRFFQRLLPEIGRYDAAAVLHDYLYQNGVLHGIPVTRADADAMLNEAMGVMKVPAWQRWAIYHGVRLGGWVVWDAYRKKDK